MSRARWRNAFAQNTYVFVRVTPGGFVGHGIARETLEGRVLKAHLVRKRFEDGQLTCDAQDGITARDGTRCDACRHPLCAPQLRIHLRQGSTTYVLDLAVTSAQNFIALDEAITATGGQLESEDLVLRVHPHGHWGEVLFRRRDHLEGM
jgi:hypothetical protein